MNLDYWICAAYTVISAAVSLGFSLAGLRSAGLRSAGLRSAGLRSAERGDRTASLYAAARSVAFFVVSIAALASNDIAAVAVVSLAMVVVQTLDAVVGFIIRDRVKTIGPAITALLGLASVIWLLSR